MRRNARNIRSNASRNTSFPSDIQAQPKFQRVFRFQLDADRTAVAIYRECLLNLLLSTSTTTKAVALIEAIRLDRVCMWAPADATSDGFNELSLTWLGPRAPASRTAAMGNSFKPGHISEKPPPDSTIGYWSVHGSNESDKLLQITAPAKTIVDIHATFVLESGAVATCSGMDRD